MSQVVHFEDKEFLGQVIGQSMYECPRHGFTNHVFLAKADDLFRKVCELCEQERVQELLSEGDW